MTRRAAIAAMLLLAMAAGCGGAAQQGRAASEESAGASATAADSGGDDGAATTTAVAGEEAPSEAGEPVPMVATSEEWDALVAADDDLGASLELSQPDCGAAEDHLERLCDLAARICDIADDTGDQGARNRCNDGTARCERGRSALEDACD